MGASIPPVKYPNRVREFRQASGMSPEELAYRTKLTSKTIERIELGKHRPRLEHGLAICRVLVRPIDVVFPESEPVEASA